MYAHLREGGKKVLRQMPTVWELARRSEEHLKGMVLPGTLFEEMGFNYIGPDRWPRRQGAGHHLGERARSCAGRSSCTSSRAKARDTRRPKRTRSNGMVPARSIRPAARSSRKRAHGPSYSQIFGQWLCDMARARSRDHRHHARDARRIGLVEFSKRFPDRYFDVAIAEQHAVTFAAGLAAEGFKPVVAIYSTFLQRAYDQLIHDVALQNLPVVFALDRAGLVGSDGATHQGSYDLTFLRCIPNMVVMAPADENECRQMLYTATTLVLAVGSALPARHGTRRARRRGDDRAARGPRATAPRGPQSGSRFSRSALWSRRRARSPSGSTRRSSTCASSSRSIRSSSSSRCAPPRAS